MNITEDVTDTDDVIEKIILKYSHHPSIKLINNNVSKGYFSFNEVQVSEVKKLMGKLMVKKRQCLAVYHQKFSKKVFVYSVNH